MTLMNLLKQRLFWKILLIFWLTTIAIIVANIYITKQIAFNEFKTKHLRSTMQTLAVDAVEIYEEHGRKALNKWYRKQAKQHQIKVVLLDGNEIPVASRNTHHPDKGFKLENNDRNDFSKHLLKMADQHVLSASGIPYILRLLPSPYLHSKFNPEALHAYRILASFLIISIGSFWIAYSIARPIQILREASNKISLGKFDTNVRKDIGNRKDELGMLAQAFDNMSSKIYELLEKQKRLFADISHEIRTPLTRQKLAIELLEDEPSNSKLLHSIGKQNKQINELINDLLRYIQSNKLAHYNFQRINLSKLLNEIVEEASLELNKKNISVKTNEPSQIDVEADARLLKRALENILRNAINYAPNDSSVYVNINLTAHNIIVSIIDEGAGVPNDEIDKLTEPFYRSDSSRNTGTGGFGLGLALSSEIIKNHRGELMLHNISPKGFEAKIVLPLS